ncbi:hypothetical protein Tco_0901657 [Tanacetum coccineum]
MMNFKGTYQVAKWNGTKVSVNILDKDIYSDPQSIGVSAEGSGVVVEGSASFLEEAIATPPAAETKASSV